MKEKKLDIASLNMVIGLGKKILKILYITLVMSIIYVSIIIVKETKIMDFILTILSICLPVFIGLLIAWLFDPVVKWLEDKGIKRVLGTLVIYILIVSVFSILISSIIPIISEQINELVNAWPTVFGKLETWINQLFARLDNIEAIDANSIKNNLFSQLEQFGVDLTNSLPSIVMNIIKSVFSGLGSFLIGFIIGFFLLVSFNEKKNIIAFLPRKIQKTTNELMEEIDVSLRTIVTGALIDCTAVFLISSLGLWAVGLKAPLLFGLFCGLTNVIPYAGPYIGGAPAVIVGFSMSPTIGILSLIVIVIIQGIEGNFLQPMIMSKTTKLHPVTIILGLLIFGHFWGIIGMIVSTPIIASVKTILLFYDEKYNILKL